jgi:hypothetical protein
MHPIEQELRNFTGTENYHRYSGLFKTLILTDGAKYLAEKAGAFWFMDIIGLILPEIHAEGFAICKIKKTGDSALFTADDGNGNIIYRRNISFTDAPFDFKVFVQPTVVGGAPYTVVMLPSEY